jgi:hypothetical protein
MVLISGAAGVRFFRFTSALAFLLIVLGIALRPAALTFGRDARGLATAALLVDLLALSLVVARQNPWRRAFLWLSAASGVLALVAQAAPSRRAFPSP